MRCQRALTSGFSDTFDIFLQFAAYFRNSAGASISRPPDLRLEWYNVGNGGKTQGDQDERTLARISSGKGGMAWLPGMFSRAPR